MKKFIWAVVGIFGMLSGPAMNVQATPYTGADIELDGVEYSKIQTGKKGWFSSDDSIYTFWDNRWVEYSAYLTAGVWNIGLNVINHGNLGTDWYSDFKISLTGSLKEDIVIPASSDEINYGYTTLNVTKDHYYKVKYKWTNDKYAPDDGLDANIQIVSGFFDNTATAPVPEPTTMLLFGTGLAGLAAFSRRKEK